MENKLFPLRKAFALKVFDGFNIQRWNDIPRPFDLIEMDKAGYKLALAYIIGKYEEKKGHDVEWEKIIYGCFFELLKKIALSDIKAPVHRMIKEEARDEFDKLNDWVVDQYEDVCQDAELIKIFRQYIHDKENLDDLSYKILRAAHKLSTIREFELVKNINPDTPRIYKIEEELNYDINLLLSLDGVQRIITKQKPYEFLCFVEQLRYQIRWSQTPRVPKTSVLGHSYFVSAITLILTRKMNMCDKRFFNNIFCSLFHDLPETVTRDIISPVKSATPNLPLIVKHIEDKIVEEQLVPTMDPYYQKELKHYYVNEFDTRILLDGIQKKVSREDLIDKYNEDSFSPIDGDIIKISDDIAAFLEADRSIEYGISSEHLLTGKQRILDKYKQSKEGFNKEMNAFFNDFDK